MKFTGINWLDYFSEKSKKSLTLVKTKEFYSVVLSSFLPKFTSYVLVPFVILKAGLSVWGEFSLLIAQIPIISLLFSFAIDAVITRGKAIDKNSDIERTSIIINSLFCSMIIGSILAYSAFLIGLINLKYLIIILIAGTTPIRFGFERALIKWQHSSELIIFQLIPALSLSLGYIYMPFQ